jgi:hypothetical protein
MLTAILHMAAKRRGEQVTGTKEIRTKHGDCSPSASHSLCGEWAEGLLFRSPRSRLFFMGDKRRILPDGRKKTGARCCGFDARSPRSVPGTLRFQRRRTQAGEVVLGGCRELDHPLIQSALQPASISVQLQGRRDHVPIRRASMPRRARLEWHAVPPNPR